MVATSTDANGNVSRFAYNTNGFLTSRTDPATNTTLFVVNDVGWKLRETNPLGDSTAYTLDLNGNPVRVQDVLGRVFNRTYDANGNLLSTTDGKLQPTTHAHDAANQRTNTTDRTGTNKWLTFYTLQGKVDRVTDPLGNTVTNTYDAANRLIRVSDPLGQSVTNQYDANGNLVALFDKLGQRWTKTYDRLNRVLAEADPLGNTRSTAYDIAGRILQTTTPNGYPTLHAYDGRGRLTKWHDAEGFDWLYTYDGNGNITDIEDALHGHYVMAYGSRNERTLEQNQDTNRWEYAYDELLRLQRQTDPNGTIRTPTYDAAGRVLFVNFSTGRRDSYAYDANDNPQTIARRVSGVTTATQFIYDALDRPTEQTDALAQTVQYGYDPLGRVTALTYPGGRTLMNRYDSLGRLTSQVDWAGRQMTYAYDQADRLIRRSWPNGVTQTNSFDDAGRLTGLSHAPSTINSNTINIALRYAYDRNGNKTGSSERGTLAWPQPSLTDETADYTAAGRLKTRTVDSLSPTGGEGQGEGAIRYAYDPSGNMTNAVRMVGTTNAESWTLTYDEDNRTTSIHWDAGLTAKHIVNRYDALGRRISKTVDGVTTGYVLSLVGGMERILCDLDNNGAVTAWYVHGPDLCYRVDADNNLICYHADAMANIIALTGLAGTNLAQYAYTPYGRSLGSTSISNLASPISNPFTFVGSQGVMEELPGLFFMRARYYSADAGLFLSTDPVKHIGPGWKPIAYGYAGANPNRYVDPDGNILQVFLGAAVGMAKGFLGEVVNQGASVLSGGRFDWDEVVTSTAAEGLGGAAAGLTGSAAVGGAVSEVYRGYIEATESGQSYSLKTGVLDALSGGATAYAFDKYVPKVSLSGGNYFGSVRGVGPSTLQGAFTSSHFRNDLAQDTFALSSRVTSMVLANVANVSPAPNQSLSSRTPDAGSHAQSLNVGQQTNPTGNSTGTGTTTQSNSNGGVSSGSGSGAFSQVVNRVTSAVSTAANSISQTVRNVAATVSQAVSTAVTSIGNFFSGLFGGRR